MYEKLEQSCLLEWPKKQIKTINANTYIVFEIALSRALN